MQPTADSNDELMQTATTPASRDRSLSATQITCFQTFSIELLQSIFWFVAIELDPETTKSPGDENDNDYFDRNEFSRQVGTLCLVCRRWRNIATGFCALWTHPPYLNYFLEDDENELTRLGSQQLEMFELFAARSGVLPLELGWGCTSRCWNMHTEAVVESLSLIVKYSLRVGELDLNGLPMDALKHLSPIRGKLPLLAHLRLSTDYRIDSGEIASSLHPLTLDYFADAPALRKVDIQLAVDIPTVLPYSQLERIRTTSPGMMSAYQGLLLAGSPHLRSFEISIGGWACRIPALPSPCTLPNLTALDFYGAGPDAALSLAAHFEMLTLPALTSLRMTCENRISVLNELLTQLLGLITRSGCSLRTLDTGPRLPVASSMPISETVFEILARSPRLDSVVLGYADAAALRRLVLDPSDQSPMLPALEDLIIDLSQEAAPQDLDLDSVNGGAMGALTWAHPDLARALTDLLSSRPGRSVGGKLRYVVLQGDGVPRVCRALVDWEQSRPVRVLGRRGGGSDAPATPAGTMVDAETLLFIEGVHDTLYPYETRGLPGCSAIDIEEDAVAAEVLEPLVRRLEEIDFETVNASILTRLGIPSTLRDLSTRRVPVPICPETEALRTLDAKLGALLEKWKPAILRDAFPLPYQWVYGDCELIIDLVVTYQDEGEYWERLTTRSHITWY